jgi:hypothetical protein
MKKVGIACAFMALAFSGGNCYALKNCREEKGFHWPRHSMALQVPRHFLQRESGMLGSQ